MHVRSLVPICTPTRARHPPQEGFIAQDDAGAADEDDTRQRADEDEAAINVRSVCPSCCTRAVCSAWGVCLLELF